MGRGAPNFKEVFNMTRWFFYEEIGFKAACDKLNATKAFRNIFNDWIAYADDITIIYLTDDNHEDLYIF